MPNYGTFDVGNFFKIKSRTPLLLLPNVIYMRVRYDIQWLVIQTFGHFGWGTFEPQQ